LSEGEHEFSGARDLQSSIITANSVASGFVFTAITIILTLHPAPSQTPVQITLFILTIMLYTFQLIVVRCMYGIQYCVKFAPKIPEGTIRRWYSTYTMIQSVSWTLLPLSIALMFFLWNLPYLALVSGLVAALTIVFCYFTTVKPYTELLKKQPWYAEYR